MARLGHFYLKSSGDVSKILLPDPAPGWQRTRPVVGGTQTTLLGTERVDMVGRRRIWSGLAWNNIPDAPYLIIAQFTDGTKGNGPFTLWDPDFDSADPGAIVNFDPAGLSDTVNDDLLHNISVTLREAVLS